MSGTTSTVSTTTETTSTVSIATLIQGQGYVRIGDVCPNFNATYPKDNDGTWEYNTPINWHKYIQDKWAILFSHPKDFTPVCTTEIAKVSELKREWAKRNTVVAVLSVDTSESHADWIVDIQKVYPQAGKIDFPIIGDEKKDVASLYGMLDQSHLDDKGLPLTVRSVFIIAPDKKVKLIITYPACTGRSFTEIIRVLDSVQINYYKKVATPVDWVRGQDVFLIPSTSDEDAKKKFPNFEVVSTSCKIRTTADPTEVANWRN